MFSPVHNSGITTFDVNAANNNEAPFDLQWLAEHFKFDYLNVKKAGFDRIGVMFEVEFKPGKESVAKQFYDSLVQKGCHPQYFEFNNSVCLNKYQKAKILSAANTSASTPILSQALTKPEVIDPLNPFANRVHNSGINTLNSENKKEIPFDLQWLAEHFKFDYSDVKSTSFDEIGVMFEVKFKPGKESVAKQFYDSLVQKGCHPQYFDFNNSVYLNNNLKEKILSAAKTLASIPIPSQTLTKPEVIDPLNPFADRVHNSGIKTLNSENKKEVPFGLTRTNPTPLSPEEKKKPVSNLASSKITIAPLLIPDNSSLVSIELKPAIHTIVYEDSNSTFLGSPSSHQVKEHKVILNIEFTNSLELESFSNQFKAHNLYQLRINIKGKIIQIDADYNSGRGFEKLEIIKELLCKAVPIFEKDILNYFVNNKNYMLMFFQNSTR